jgi:hypothetical protein
MKIFKSAIFAFVLFFSAYSPIFAGWSGCIPVAKCAVVSGGYCGTNTALYQACSNPAGCAAATTHCDCLAKTKNCSDLPPPGGDGGNGGNGGGGDGGLSTNIDAQAQDFFAYQSFDKFLPNLLQIALILGAIAAFAFLIWGGIDYIISGGNQERVKTSKTMIGNALAGLAILAAAWVIWRLITYFLGLSPTLKGPFDIKLPTP